MNLKVNKTWLSLPTLTNFHKIHKFYPQKYFVKDFCCGLSLYRNIYIIFIKLWGDAIIDYVNIFNFF